MGRRKGLPINGVLLLDKPAGLSSNTALQRARRALGAAKAGHTGTLDPMASGLLPIAFGEATKFTQYLLDADKTYLAEVCLGVTTDTGDAEGRVVSTSSLRPTATEIADVCARFVGVLDQVPPMYSALKRDGKALYEYARAGVEVERTARRVTIHALELGRVGGDRFECRVRCSKGTYIRTLAEDMGKALGCGAHLTRLVRESSGAYHLESAVSLQDLEAATEEARGRMLLPADSFVEHFPLLKLNDEEATRICRGQPVRLQTAAPEGIHRLCRGADFLGLGQVDGESRLSSLRLLAT